MQKEANISHIRSGNCKPGDKPTVMFAYSAQSMSNPQMEHSSYVLSCQGTDFETADAVTLKTIENQALDKLSARFNTSVEDLDIDVQSIRLGHQQVSDAAKDVVKHRMASNCGPDYNLKNVTSYNKFQCRYLGTGVDDRGRVVRNPFQVWRGTLPSCDNSIEITDDVESDIRKLAYDAAGGDEAKLDVNQFLCTIQSIPFQ